MRYNIEPSNRFYLTNAKSKSLLFFSVFLFFQRTIFSYSTHNCTQPETNVVKQAAAAAAATTAAFIFPSILASERCENGISGGKFISAYELSSIVDDTHQIDIKGRFRQQEQLDARAGWWC